MRAAVGGGNNGCAMSATIRVLRPSEFLRARTDGRVDIGTGKALLAELADAAESLDRYEVMIDIRNAVGQLSADDVIELASSLIDFRNTFLHKTAILCPRERFDT